MKVLVTGGTGFVGRAVVAALAREGHRPALLARRPDAPVVHRLAAATGATVFAGDVLEPDTLPPAFAGTEAVVHLVGIISECGAATFDRVHRVGTENVVTAARREPGIRRFVHMSALGTRPEATSRYRQTKWAAEEAVRASQLDWTIFRPSVIFGPGDQFLNRFARMSRWSPVMPLLGSGRGRLQPVAVEDVATAFARALSEPRAVGRAFDLCGPEILTLEQVLDALLAGVSRRRVKFRIPLPLARALAAALECLWPLLLRRPVLLTCDQLLMLEEANVGDPAPAVTLFGLRHQPLAAEIRKHRDDSSHLEPKTEG